MQMALEQIEHMVEEERSGERNSNFYKENQKTLTLKTSIQGGNYLMNSNAVQDETPEIYAL